MYGRFFGWRVTASYHVENLIGNTLNFEHLLFLVSGDQLKGVTEEESRCADATEWDRPYSARETRPSTFEP